MQGYCRNTWTILRERKNIFGIIRVAWKAKYFDVIPVRREEEGTLENVAPFCSTTCVPFNARLHRRFLSRNSIQFLSRWSCIKTRGDFMQLRCDIAAIKSPWNRREVARVKTNGDKVATSRRSFKPVRNLMQLRRGKNCIELRDKNRLCKQAFSLTKPRDQDR